MNIRFFITRQIFFIMLCTYIPISIFASGEPDSSDYDLDTTGARWSDPIQITFEDSIPIGTEYTLGLSPDDKWLYFYHSNRYDIGHLKKYYLTTLNLEGELQQSNIVYFMRNRGDCTLFTDIHNNLWAFIISYSHISYFNITNNGDTRLGNLEINQLGDYPNHIPARYLHATVIQGVNGEVMVWYIRRYYQTNRYVLAWYKLSSDLTEVIDEGELEESESIGHNDLGPSSGDITTGPGDTIHVAYTSYTFTNNILQQRLYYAKVGWDGEVFFGPVSHTPTDRAWYENMDNDGGIVVDHSGNAYIVSAYKDAGNGNWWDLKLHLFLPDSEYLSKIVEEETRFGSGESDVVIDALGRVHVLYASHNNPEGRQTSVMHCAFENADTTWVIEPHSIIRNGLHNSQRPSQISVKAHPSKYSIAVTYKFRSDDMESPEVFMCLLNNTENMYDQMDQVKTDINDSPEKTGEISITPNPFNSFVRINISVQMNSEPKVSIYDILGRKVSDIRTQYFSDERQYLYWDGTDGYGNIVGSGVYLLRIKTGNNFYTKKIFKLD
ncbi:MAG: T9SS type A sorting domain-containing protein [Candidatus Electryonea clarkiae]|nr:T9SS type A sorting domain-containing protein [Candidatus Electryonea clarkiae]MDP8285204.1 T9SS type A sorting domain-containing protein [Candidatus Electryonea clarkiae]